MSASRNATSPRRLFARDGGGWFAVGLLARMYLIFVATLAVIAILPAVFGWHGSVVQTGSMQPKISPGDVVLTTPLAENDPVPVGGVVRFRSSAITQPDGQERFILHRIVAVGEKSGEYVTAGDANADVDSTPITREQIVGQGRLLVPFVGLPSLWIGSGAVLPLTIWLLITAGALGVVLAPLIPRRRRVERGDDASEPTAERVGDSTTRRGRRALIAGSAGVTVLTLLAVPGLLPASPVVAAFTARTVMAGSSWQVAAGLDDRGYGNYSSVVASDRPWAYYPMDEAETSFTARDRSGNGRDGRYSWFGISGTSGALAQQTNRAITVNGSAAATFATPTLVNAPTDFALELWFRTGSGAGGELISFGSSRSGTSATTSRKLYLGSDGRLRFGGSRASGAVVTSTRSYNDSAWHHVVASLGPSGTILYVDGARVGSNSRTAAPAMTGYWRFGGDSIGGWPGNPTSAYFAGSIDEVAIYDIAALSAQRVQAHHAAQRPDTALNYPDEVKVDMPSYYYHLDEGGPGAIRDYSGARNDMTYPATGITHGVEGVLVKRNNRAAMFSGGTSSMVTQSAHSDPQTFSVEMWFNTTSRRGGQLIGFGNSTGTLPTRHDRKVYMTDEGRLIFGVYPGVVKTVSSARAYNDGNWHHMVATLSSDGMRLYVDGSLVASDATVRAAERYTGYWSAGDGLFSGWPSAPSSGNLAGTLDEIAVYDSALTPERVFAHYDAR